MAAKTGYQHVLKVDGTACGAVREVNADFDSDLVDATMRGGNGWKEKLQGLKDWKCSLKAVRLLSDAQLVALRSAYLAGTTVAIQILDATSGNGWSGNALVKSLKQAEPLTDLVTWDIELEGTGAASVV
jgi:predicted secreted protein